MTGTVNILGQEYTLHTETEKENPKLKDNVGLCEVFSKRIILDTSVADNDPDTVENVEEYFHKVLRHEAFHAILFEAGWTDYYHDESLVDALATLYPKIESIMNELKKVDIYANSNSRAT